jgi:hypothetical protein
MLLHDLEVEAGGSAAGLFSTPDGRLVLRVPYGMEHLDPTRSMALLYMAFVVFRSTRRSLKRLSAADGVEMSRGGGGASTNDVNISFHDALALDALFDRVDPRRVLSLCDRHASSTPDPFRRLDRHLHRALFDDNGAAFIERAPGRRRWIRYGRADIVGLYCFLALDFYQHFLEVDPARCWGSFLSEGTSAAADFRHRYLTPDDSLYLGSALDRDKCRQRMRHLLNMIDRTSVLQSGTYRELYEALHRYLNAGIATGAPEGQIWGVNDFWAVWESACLNHALADSEKDLQRIFTCDFEHLPSGLATTALEARWLALREKVFARNDIRRRPDLVLDRGGRLVIVDFKYHAEPVLRRPKTLGTLSPLIRMERDFSSMETYGLLLANHLLSMSRPPAPVTLEMWLPGHSASVSEVDGDPRWDPPLAIRTLSTSDVMTQYSRLYGAGLS